LTKSLKDSDFSLVSNGNLSEMLPSSSWGLGQVTWAKLAKNLPHLWRHSLSQKNWNPSPKKLFFIADSETCRVFWGFKQLSSAIA